MPLPKPDWQFIPNTANCIIGPRDKGIEHYTNQPIPSLIRETIQNSLDAQTQPGATVRVTVRIENLNPDSINGAQLTQHLQAAMAAWSKNDNQYWTMFRKAKKMLSEKSISTLVISDTNTKGAEDDGSENSPWRNLTRGSGASRKESAHAVGSFGLGKAAAFAVTSLRTVLYSTAVHTDGQLETRFIGRAILCGHLDPKGQKVTSEGFFGNPEFQDLKNGEIPPAFQLTEPGTRIFIPGFIPEPRWQEEFARLAIVNFGPAIAWGKLEIRIENRSITALTLQQQADQLLDNTKDRYLIRTVLTEPVNSAEIPGIGTVNLYLQIHEDEPKSIHEIALARDAGMIITRIRQNMGPIQNHIRTSPHWKDFTAIVHVKSDPPEHTFIRDCESPSHNELSVKHIMDPEREKQAGAALRRLGLHIREQIEKHAEPPTGNEAINAGEAAGLLPFNPDNPAANTYRAGGLEVSQPVQRPTAIRNVNPPKPAPPDPEGKKPKPNSPHEKLPPKPALPVKQPVLSQAKYRPGDKHPTHSLTIEIPAGHETYNNVQLKALGEQGSVEVRITDAWLNGKTTGIRKGKITRLPLNSEKPSTLEIKMPEPAAGKRYYLQPAQSKGNK